MAPVTFPSHVDRKTPAAVPGPCAATKLPNATTTSDGNGGKRFSRAAVAQMTEYSVAGETCSSHWSSESTSSRSGYQRGDGDAGDALTAADPPHPLVRFRLHAHIADVDTHGMRQPLAHRLAVRGEARRFRHDGDVGLADREPEPAHMLHRGAEHLRRVASRVFRIVVAKHLADVPRAGGAEDGVRQRMARDVPIRVPGEMQIEGDAYAPEHQRARVLEAVRVVAQPDAHQAATGSSSGMML